MPQNIPPGVSLEQVDYPSATAFDTTSSFALRILAVRNLAGILGIYQTLHPDERAWSTMDSNLASWKLNLPSQRSEPFDHEGNLDEMLFQAHMIHSACVPISMHSIQVSAIANPVPQE